MRTAVKPVKTLRLVAGLGNPGKAYAGTRHNAGFAAIDDLARFFGIRLDKKKFAAAYGRGAIAANAVILAKPMAFMNRSGTPLKQLAQYYRIECRDWVILHDDIDLALGSIKIKQKGGSGGHRGIRSLMDACGHGDFTRVRIGVGRPGPGMEAADHVLAAFSARERRVFDQVIPVVREAVATILCENAEVAMNRFNGLSTLSSG